MTSSGVFDAIVIQDIPGRVLVTIQRPTGPLESGRFIEGSWFPDDWPEQVRADGFGISASNGPYYDSGGADPGEAASLWIDPSTGDIWLEAI